MTAPLFGGALPFFLADDKVQVRYEMLRAHAADGVSVTEAARAHGYSRAGFYVVESAFETAGILGLIDERRGRKGPLKVTPDILAFLRRESGRSSEELVDEIEARFGVSLHRRTVERARRG